MLNEKYYLHIKMMISDNTSVSPKEKTNDFENIIQAKLKTYSFSTESTI